MSRADDAHVDLLTGDAADRDHLARLQRAQELCLRLERHVPDLVEQQRAAVGRADDAGMIARRAAEAPLLEAEELALDERLRDGRAVQRAEGAWSSAPRVKRTRDELLAGTGLTEDEHRKRRGRDVGELGGHPRELRAADRPVDRDALGPGRHVAVDAVRYERAGATRDEADQDIADADHVTVGEERLGDAPAPDHHAVTTAEIAKHEAVARAGDAHVHPRDRGMRDDHMRGRGPPDDRHLGIEGEDRRQRGERVGIEEHQTGIGSRAALRPADLRTARGLRGLAFVARHGP